LKIDAAELDFDITKLPPDFLVPHALFPKRRTADCAGSADKNKKYVGPGGAMAIAGNRH
jgi:hypothetical protein